MAKGVKIEVDFTIAKAMNAMQRLHSKISQTVSQANKLGSSSRQVSNSLNNANKQSNKLKNDLKSADIYAKSMAESSTIISKALVGVALGSQFFNAADTYGSAVNKLNYINSEQIGEGGKKPGVFMIPDKYSKQTKDLTALQLEKSFQAAQRARTGYGDFVGNVGKQAILAGKAFDNNIDNVIKFNELMGKAYAISGATAEEQSASMMQLTQALGAGVMQGDELKSVREGATLAYQMIEQFAQKIYDTDESLKELGAQGLITSDIVVAAILENSKKLDDAMELTGITLGQFFTMVKNDFFHAFSPALEEFNKFLAKLKNSVIYDTFVETIHGLGKGLQFILRILNKILDVIDANKETVKPILKTIGSFLTIFVVLSLVRVQFEILRTIAKFLHLGDIIKNLPLLAFAFAVFEVYKALEMAANGTKNTLTLIATSLLVVASMFSVIAGIVIMSANPIIGVLLIILGVISGVIAYCVYTENSIIRGIARIVGTAAQSIAVVKTLFKDVGEYISAHLVALKSAFFTVLKNIQTIFKNFTHNIIHYWDSMISSLAKTKLGQKLGLEAFSRYSRVPLNHGTKNAVSVYNAKFAENYDGESPIEQGNAAYQLWYSKVLTWGHKAQSAFKDVTSSIGDIPTLDNLGLDYSAPDIGNALGDIADTADNTDKISDNMKLLTEDLSYLKELAELEWKKEFTTANINVSMTNNNNIDNKADIGDIVTSFRDALLVELETVAAGSSRFS